MKLIKDNPKTYTIELTQDEIYNLVYRLKFIRQEHSVLPDLTEATWKELEKLLPIPVTEQLYQ